jgi:hypothetical protein
VNPTQDRSSWVWICIGAAVLVRTTHSGELPETVRIVNDAERLAASGRRIARKRGIPATRRLDRGSLFRRTHRRVDERSGHQACHSPCCSSRTPWRQTI